MVSWVFGFGVNMGGVNGVGYGVLPVHRKHVGVLHILP